MHPNRKDAITHEQARKSLQRFVNLHFKNVGEKSRASIPAHQDDDDILLSDYISQQELVAHPGLGSGALREALNFAAVLRKHWLAGVTCHHAEIPGDGSWDRASCACSEVDFPKAETVGEAVEMWIQHVLVEATLSLSSPIEPQHCNAPNPDGKYLCNKEPHSTGDHVHSFINPDKQNDFYFWPATSQASSEIREKK